MAVIYQTKIYRKIKPHQQEKGFTCIVLQCICNEHMILIDAFAGWPVSVNDARGFRNSPIVAEIIQIES